MGEPDVAVTVNLNNSSMSDEYSVVGTIATPITGREIRDRRHQRVVKVHGVDMCVNSGKNLISPGQFIRVSTVPLMTPDNLPGVSRKGDKSGRLIPQTVPVTYTDISDLTKTMQKVATDIVRNADEPLYDYKRSKVQEALLTTVAMLENMCNNGGNSAFDNIQAVVPHIVSIPLQAQEKTVGPPNLGGIDVHAANFQVGMLNDLLTPEYMIVTLVEKLLSLVAPACALAQMNTKRARRLMSVYLVNALVDSITEKFTSNVTAALSAARSSTASMFTNSDDFNLVVSIFRPVIHSAVSLLRAILVPLVMQLQANAHECDAHFKEAVYALHGPELSTGINLLLHRTKIDRASVTLERLATASMFDQLQDFAAKHDNWERRLEQDLFISLRYAILGKALSRASTGQQFTVLVGARM